MISYSSAYFTISNNLGEYIPSVLEIRAYKHHHAQRDVKMVHEYVFTVKAVAIERAGIIC